MDKITNLSEFAAARPDTVILDQQWVGTTVHEQARESQQLLQEVSTGTVPGEGFKELVLARRPDHEDPFWPSTGTYHKVFKKYAIDNEMWNESSAVNDGFYQGVFATDEGEHKLQGIFDTIISPKHLDLANPDGESWKDKENRDPAFFPALSSMVTRTKPLDPTNEVNYGDAFNLLIEAEANLPATYQSGARWYMNSRTRSLLRKLRNTDGSLLMISDKDGQFFLMGYPVTIWESIPDIVTDATRLPTTPDESVWLMFGNMSNAVKVSDVEGSEKFINNPYNEGFKELKYETKYGVFGLDTTGLIVICQQVSPETNTDT